MFDIIVEEKNIDSYIEKMKKVPNRGKLYIMNLIVSLV